MNKIKTLAQISFSERKLNPYRVDIIKNYLKRKELRQYIKELEKIIKKNTVFVSSSLPIDEQDKKNIKSHFPNKEIEYTIDDSLIMGMKIIDNDTVYEMNLKKMLENISSHIMNTYD